MGKYNKIISADSLYLNLPNNVDNFIKSMINDFESSGAIEAISNGEAYYRSENTEIMNRRIMICTTDSDGNPVVVDDPYKSNNKVPSGFLKLLIDQKINYSLSNRLTYSSEDKEVLSNEIFNNKFQKYLKKLGKEAGKKGSAWLHVFIDDKGLFNYKLIPREQIIPIYSNVDNDKLIGLIRYYDSAVRNSNDELINTKMVEFWDDKTVTYYSEDTNGGYSLMSHDSMNIYGNGDTLQNPRFHFQKDKVYGNSTVVKSEGLSWGRIPFIPLYNNDEEESDLSPIKSLIDAYDKIASDFINNLEDFQDVYWILRGYGEENLGEFLDQVKRYKVVKTDEEGDARTEKLEVPYEARKEALLHLKELIYVFGQGFDSTSVGDGNVTNIVIKSRFANLDLKAGQFEQELKDFIFEFLDMYNVYRTNKGQKPLTLDDVVFDRSTIVNTLELLDSNMRQRGNVSEITRLKNHIWVNDPEKEKEQLEIEMAESILHTEVRENLTKDGLDNEGDTDEEQPDQK